MILNKEEKLPLDEYLDSVKRTKSGDYEKIHERFGNNGNSFVFLECINKIISNTISLDLAKKHFFYGKSFPNDFKLNLKSNEGKLLTDSNSDVDLVHAAIGIQTESAELLNALVSEGDLVDLVNIEEELGDLLWYVGLAILSLREKGHPTSFEQVLSKNMGKLKKRYPNGFTEKDAVNRDLEKERSVLED